MNLIHLNQKQSIDGPVFAMFSVFALMYVQPDSDVCNMRSLINLFSIFKHAFFCVLFSSNKVQALNGIEVLSLSESHENKVQQRDKGLNADIS